MNFNKNIKRAYTLFELILVLFISSIVLIYTFNFQKELYQSQIINEEIAILKIDLNSSKIIIEKNLVNIEEKLNYDGSTLFFEDNILLNNVSSFEMTKSSNILIITIKLEGKISQTWEFKL